ILLGNTIYTLGVTMFIIPNQLITGGTTGLALVASRQFGISVSSFILISNTLMFLLGAFVLGKKFAVTTLISSFFYPLILEIVQRLPGIDTFTTDKLLATICAGIMIGFGIGMVLSVGASTGGLDIPPLIFNKKFGWSISISLYTIDFSILLLQMLFSSKEQILYGILLVLIYSLILDKVLLTGSTKTQVKIISKKHKEINTMIIHQLDRGSTLIHADTGFYGHETNVVLTIISNRELSKLNQMVLSIDPHAFMIINQVNEVKGRGFTLDKVYR
ncbi:MAG: YitT family protein, partial [Acetivibrio sp.]